MDDKQRRAMQAELKDILSLTETVPRETFVVDFDALGGRRGALQDDVSEPLSDATDLELPILCDDLPDARYCKLRPILAGAVPLGSGRLSLAICGRLSFPANRCHPTTSRAGCRWCGRS